MGDDAPQRVDRAASVRIRSITASSLAATEQLEGLPDAPEARILERDVQPRSGPTRLRSNSFAVELGVVNAARGLLNNVRCVFDNLGFGHPAR